MDHRHSLDELNDRFAIADLYDRQLAAAEAWDFAAYDTTFTPDAEIDLSDFGVARQRYPAYRRWLEALRPTMPHAQRVIGGLRLALDGDVATTRVPVICHATVVNDGVRSFVALGLFYADRLERTRDGWRIVSRREELSWRNGEPRLP